MKSLRSKLTVVLAFFALIAISFGFMLMPSIASAKTVDTSTGFYAHDGAEIRVEDDGTGIKWTATITKAQYDKIAQDNGEITEIGISIIPTGADESMRQYYPYGGVNNAKLPEFGEATEFTYSWAVFYDQLVQDLTGKDLGEGNTLESLLDKAYAMNLEATPYVVAGTETIFGESYNTSRSMRSIATYWILSGKYDNDATRLAKLKSFLPYELNPVEDIEYKAEDSFFSNYDGAGKIAISDGLKSVMATAKVYYGAKDVTDSYNAETGILSLSGVEVKETVDGSVSDYLTVVDTATGNVYKQYFVGVTLAIDEVTDLAYFRVNDVENYGKHQTCTDKFVDFANGDVEFDGYYVLLNNINASGYTHDFANGTTFAGASYGTKNFQSYTAPGKYLENKGLTGTFDGRGYVINGGSFKNGGLFGFLNGGTVKNFGFSESTGFSNAGLLAFCAVNNSTITECFFYLTGTRNWGWNTPHVLCGITEGSTFSKSFVYWGEFHHPNGADGVINEVGEHLNSVIKDVYYVTDYNQAFSITAYDKYDVVNKTTNATGTYYLHKASADARYVDGVEQANTHKTFYRGAGDSSIYSLDTHNITLVSSGAVQEPYTYFVLENVKRYSSFDKMGKDKANNDFTSWNSEVWEIVDGVPYFASVLTGEYNICVGANKITDANNTIDLPAGESVNVSSYYINDATLYAPVVEIVSGGEYISLSGTKITANAQGVATIKVSYKNIVKIVTINVLVTPTVIEREYKFSAVDGLFFDDSYNVVSLANVIGFDTGITKIIDHNGKPLTLSEGKVLGMDTSAKDWEEGFIAFYTEQGGVKVYLQIAELIIDEATDLSYFGLKSAVTTRTTPAAGEAVWDGYYVLGKNIDASSYVHSFAGTSGFKTSATLSAEKALTLKGKGLYGKYLTGTFDGQGYVIKNLKYSTATDDRIGGIFGIINGGTVKNVAFTGSQFFASSYSGLLAGYVLNNAVISDVYIYVSGSRNAGAEHGLIARGIDRDATLTRVVVEWYSTKNMPISSGVLVDYDYLSDFLACDMTDCYFIGDIPAVLTDTTTANYTNSTAVNKETGATDKTGRFHMVAADALYVDAVKNETSTAKTFHVAWNLHEGNAYSTDKYNVTINGKTYSEPYSIGILTGLKRYTSTSMMNTAEAKALNDFSSWSGIWTIVNGVPYFTTAYTLSSFNAFIDDVAVDSTMNEVERGTTYTVNVKRQTELQLTKATLEVVEGADKVRISGNTFTALANGTAVIKAVFGVITFTINLSIVNPVVEYEKELQFSAHDGVFFDGQNDLSINEIFGKDVNVVAATDAAGNQLTIEDGAIKGVTFSKKDAKSTWLDDKITLYTEDATIVVDVKVAELIIDEAEDLDYFTLKNDWDYGTTAGWTYTFHADDFEWHGLYVLAKNIDATGYVHDMSGNTQRELGNRQGFDAHTANRLDYTGGFKWQTKGFKGVLDGQGYTITNLTTINRNGLLGIIFGGVVKNIGLVDCNKDNDYSHAPLAWGIANYSTLENIYVSTPTAKRVHCYANTPLIASWSSTTYNVTNVVIIDNNTYANTFSFGYSIGSLTYQSERGDTVGETREFGKANGESVPMNNVFILSTIPMSLTVAANQAIQEATVNMDAEYINGDLNENEYTISIKDTNSNIAKPIKGVYRYTSQGELTKDVADLTAKFKQLTDTTYFTVSAEGVIGWAKA